MHCGLLDSGLVDRESFHSLVDEFDRINVDAGNEVEELEHYASSNRLGRIFKVWNDFWTHSHIYFQYPKWKQELLKASQSSNKLPDWDIYGYWLRFHAPMRFVKKSYNSANRASQSKICCPIRVSLMYLFLFYTTIKYVFVAIIHISYDRAIKGFNPNLNGLRNQTDYTSRCLLLDRLSEDDRSIARRIATLSSYIKFVGSPSHVEGISFPYLLLLTVAGVLILINFALLNPNNPKFRLNSWMLHLNPMLERQRLQSEMLDLINRVATKSTKQDYLEQHMTITTNDRSMTRSNEHPDSPIAGDDSRLAKYYDNFCKYLRRKRDEKPIAYERDELIRFNNRRLNNDLDLYGTRNSIGWVEFANSFRWFEQMLHENEREKDITQSFSSITTTTTKSTTMTTTSSSSKDLRHCDSTPEISNTCERFELIPAHLMLHNYKKLVSWAFMMIIGASVSFITVAVLCCYLMFFREFGLRIDQRFEEIHCRLWNPAAIPSKLFSKLPDFRNPTDELEYLSVGRSNNLLLGFRYELPALLTLPTIYFWTEISIFYVVYCGWISIYTVITGLNHLSQTQWLDQINMQLKLCGLMMNKYSESKLHSHNNQTSPWGSRPNQFARKQIERALSISYINFMLFRKEQMYDRPLFKFVVVQLSLTVFFDGVVTISFLRNTDDPNGIIMWGLTMFTVLTLNICAYLLLSFTDRIYSIFHELDGIMCKAILVSMQSSAILGRWRRQIMSSQEIFNNYGVEIVGIEFTQANFVQFNSYVFGLSLYFLYSRW